MFSVEPLPADHPFRKLDNLALTPHLGYATEDGLRIHYGQMVEAIDAFTKGSDAGCRGELALKTTMGVPRHAHCDLNCLASG